MNFVFSILRNELSKYNAPPSCEVEEHFLKVQLDINPFLPILQYIAPPLPSFIQFSKLQLIKVPFVACQLIQLPEES